MLKYFSLDENHGIIIMIHVVTLELWGSPKNEGENMATFGVLNIIVQYKLHSWKLLSDWRHSPTCVLDYISFKNIYFVLITKDI